MEINLSDIIPCHYAPRGTLPLCVEGGAEQENAMLVTTVKSQTTCRDCIEWLRA